MATKYEPGTFCWADLASNDLAGAKAFYAALLGWRMHDSQGTGGTTYSTAFVGDDDVAGIHSGATGKPMWLVYISVASVDDATKKAKVLGAEIARAPHDVMDLGRTAVIKGPTGAPFAIWEGKKRAGAGKTRANGAMTWFELTTSDVATATSFYRGMFGWTAAASPEYTMWQKNDVAIGGMMPIPQEAAHSSQPSNWRVYFQVADVDSKVEQATKLGATIVVPPTNIPGSGRFSLLIDPQGASFALYGATV